MPYRATLPVRSKRGAIHRYSAIEQAFAKIKALLRTAAARTVPELWAAIWDAFGRFTPRECRNYPVAAGNNTDHPT